ncbi:MAG: hypothetical protein AAGA30_07995, partial [Planctomycetota bacterium]
TDRITAAAESYGYWWEIEFSKEHDPSQIHGETNHFRYKRRPWHVLRLNGGSDRWIESTILTLVACLTTGCAFELSVEELSEPFEMLKNAIQPIDFSVVVESQDELATKLARLRGGALRVLGHCDFNIIQPEKIGNIPILRNNVLANGRIELLNFLREQSITEIVHRYGNIV